MTTTVLIVDEDARFVAALETALAREGYSAMGVHTFADGRRLLRGSRPAVLVAGVRLGPFNGLHLLLHARGEQPDVKTIMLGPLDSLIEREARAFGASTYLAKPVTVDAVVAEVATVAPLFLPAARDDHDQTQQSRAATMRA
jgi:ActR/RegA family two-component response regulator